jgi:Domain of unknown function (DUF4398)
MISSRAMARRVCRLRLPHSMLAVVCAGVLAGCGPIVYVSEVTFHASDAVDAARAAHADKYAPYWWTRATQYLAKAREVAAYADFQGANRFGRLATEAANKATEEAQIAEKDPSKRTLDEQPDVAPAKDPAGSPGATSNEPPASLTAPAKRAPGSRAAPAKDGP